MNSSNRRNTVAWALLPVGVVIATLAIFWIANANGLAIHKIFGPASEQVRRETFEQSKAYRDGIVQELAAMRVEYVKADDKLKPALASLIRHKAAGVPADALPTDLAVFLKGIQ